MHPNWIEGSEDPTGLSSDRREMRPHETRAGFCPQNDLTLSPIQRLVSAAAQVALDSLKLDISELLHHSQEAGGIGCSRIERHRAT